MRLRSHCQWNWQNMVRLRSNEYSECATWIPQQGFQQEFQCSRKDDTHSASQVIYPSSKARMISIR